MQRLGRAGSNLWSSRSRVRFSQTKSLAIHFRRHNIVVHRHCSTSTESTINTKTKIDNSIFSKIAARYDLMCDLFSFGIHRYWKHVFVRKLDLPKRTDNSSNFVYLDVGGGTAHVPILLLRRLSRLQPAALDKTSITVLDINKSMLDVGKTRMSKSGALEGVKSKVDVSWKIDNAESLQTVPSESVDVYTIAFTIKICDIDAVLKEAYRVLKPGGQFVCVESSTIPNRLVWKLYLTYMDIVIPLIGRIAARGDKNAYSFLLAGIKTHPPQRQFIDKIKEYGFVDSGYRNMTIGIAAVHWGRKPMR